MKNRLEQFFEVVRQVRLTEWEKQAVLKRLNVRAGLYAAPARRPSPFAEFWTWTRQQFDSRFRTFGIVSAVIVLILFTGAGISLAAEGALPGDILYPIKVGITEKVRELAATSVETKAEVSVRLAERRIEEATLLAAQGVFNEKTRDDLEARFTEHIGDAVASIERSSVGADRKVELVSDLEANIEGRIRAVERLEVKSGIKDKEGIGVEIELGKFARVVRKRIEKVAEVKTKAEQELRVHSQGVFEEVLSGRKKVVERKLEEAARLIGSAETAVGVRAVAGAREKLAAARDAMSSAAGEIGADNFEEAFEIFQKARFLAEEARSIADTKLRIDHLRRRKENSGGKSIEGENRRYNLGLEAASSSKDTVAPNDRGGDSGENFDVETPGAGWDDNKFSDKKENDGEKIYGSDRESKIKINIRAGRKNEVRQNKFLDFSIETWERAKLDFLNH